MNISSARKFLILSSLVILGAQMIFLTVAPSIGFPLQYPKNLHLIDIVSPVFLGYLGSASHFIFQQPAPDVPVQSEFLGILVRGPIIVYTLVVISALSAFSYSNRVGAEIGSGMSEDALSTALSLALGVLAVTTGVITSYLFVAPKRP
jgi:hypothetical protein